MKRLVFAAALLAMLACQAPAAMTREIAEPVPAPDISAEHWINSAPLTLEALRGKVVLVEFWTFACWNCKNVEPHVKGWHEKYAGRGLTIVGGHIGYPWTEEMVALATKYPNVYIDTSAYKPARYPAALVEYLRERGRHKVLFGSNFPMIQPKACLEQLPGLGLDDEATQLFVGDNAARVFGL